MVVHTDLWWLRIGEELFYSQVMGSHPGWVIIAIRVTLLAWRTNQGQSTWIASC